LASGGEDKTISIMSALNLKLMDKGLEDWVCESSVESLSFSPDGKILASGHKKGQVWLWQIDYLSDGRDKGAGGQVRVDHKRRLAYHTKEVKAIEFSPDGTMLATAGSDNEIVIWDMTKNPMKQEPVSHYVVEAKVDARSNVSELAHNVASAFRSGIGGLASNAMGAMSTRAQRAISEIPDVEDFSKHTESIVCLSWSPDSRFLCSGSKDNSVRIWNFSQPDEIEVMILQGHKHDVRDVCFSPDGQYLASVGGTGFNSRGNEIRIWDMADADLGDEEQVCLLTGHDLGITSVIWAGNRENSNVIITGSYDKTIKFWSIENEKCIRTISCEEEVRCLAAGHKGRYLAYGNPEGYVKKHHIIFQIEGYEKKLNFAFSAGGLEMENLIKHMVEDPEQPLADGGMYLIVEYLLHNDEGAEMTLFWSTIWNLLVKWDEESSADNNDAETLQALDDFTKLEHCLRTFLEQVDKFKPDILDILCENLEGKELQVVAETEIAKVLMEIYSRGGVMAIYWGELFLYTLYMTNFAYSTVSLKFKQLQPNADSDQRQDQMEFNEKLLMVLSLYFFFRECYQIYKGFFQNGSIRSFFLWIEKNKVLNICLWALGISALTFLFQGKQQGFLAFAVTWAVLFAFPTLGFWETIDIMSPAGSMAILYTYVNYGPGDSFNHIASGVAVVNWMKFLNVIRTLSQQIATFILMIEFIMRDIKAFLVVQIMVMVMFGHAFYLELSETEMSFHDEFSSNPYSTMWKTFQTLFNMLIGDFDSSIYGYEYVKILFMAYMFVVVIIMLNVLIAIVSDSYAEAMSQSDQLYYMSRLELIVEIRDTFRTPLSLIPTPERTKEILGKFTPDFIVKKTKRNKHEITLNFEKGDLGEDDIWDDRIEEIATKVKEKMMEEDDDKPKTPVEPTSHETIAEEDPNAEELEEIKNMLEEQKTVNARLEASTEEQKAVNARLEASNDRLQQTLDGLIQKLDAYELAVTEED